MLALWHSVVRRLKGRSSPKEEQRRDLYTQERALAKAFHEVFGAYERRLAYLEGRLVRASQEELMRDRQMFEEAHKSLARTLHRLRFADAEEETLLREWHDWHRPHASVHDMKEYGDRLELLRSELVVRKRLPKELGNVSDTKPPAAKPRQRTYVPSALSQDTLSAFEKVYGPRLEAHKRHMRRTVRQLAREAQHPAHALLGAYRVKRAHAQHKRFSRLIERVRDLT